MPRSVAVLLAAAAGLFSALFFASPAAAHATVESTEPSADVVVDTAPDDIVIAFSESVSPVSARTGVLAPDGSRADIEDESEADGSQLRIPLRDDLPEGTYLVSYRVISADGHPVNGGYTFSIGRQTEPPSADALPGAGDERVVDTAVAVNRYLAIAGLALALGPAVLLVAGGVRAGGGVHKLIAAGLSTVAVTAVTGLYLQAPYTAGTSLTEVTGDDIGAVFNSNFGAANMLRLLIVLASLPLLRIALQDGLGRVQRWGLAGLALGLAATWPISGHAVASPAPALLVITDTTHVAAGTLWIGGLVTLAACLLRERYRTAAEDFLPTWSRWATWLVAALALAGTTQALVEIGTVDALLTTRYGWLVITKVGLLAVLVTTAAVARDEVKSAAEGLVVAIRRIVLIELAVLAVVVGVTAVLVQTVPARVDAEESDLTAGDYYAATLTTDLYTVQFEMDPGGVGNNSVHLYLFEDDGITALPAEEWIGSYGGAGVAAVDIPLVALSPNHVTGEITIPAAGDWEFQFTIRTSEIDQATVTQVVTIE